MQEINEFISNILIRGSEEVYASGYDTAGNYHWTGTKTGEHSISASEEQENESRLL